jgi:hypothetical protein
MKVLMQLFTIIFIVLMIEPAKQDQGLSNLAREAFNQEADQIPCKNFSHIHGEKKKRKKNLKNLPIKNQAS